MDNIQNAIKRIVSDVVGGIPHPRFATVTAFDPATHSAKVIIQPDGLQTGWLPMHAVAVGNGIGMVIPPKIGDQVTVTPKEGDSDNYVISGRFFHDDAMAPVSSITGKALDSGEVGIFAGAGSFLHITTDGIFHFKGDAIFDGNVTVLKDLAVTGASGGSGEIKSKGDMIDKDGVHGSVDLLRTDHNEHKHPGVKAGGDTTATPDKITP